MYDKVVDIVMVTYLREPVTTKSLTLIKERTKTPHRVILVDNGSSENSVEEWFDNQLFDVYLQQQTNVGLEVARNIGTKESTAEYVVHIDNDIFVPLLEPDWIQQLISLKERNPEYAAIALRPQILVGVGPIFKDAQEVVENNVVGGVGRLMDRAIIEQVGGWDDMLRNNGRGTEEWDICGKLRANGYKVGYARDLYAYHMFIDDNWGYPEGMKFGRVLPSAPLDIEYNHLTMEPVRRGNE